jgi:hypothetical protein
MRPIPHPDHTSESDTTLVAQTRTRLENNDAASLRSAAKRVVADNAEVPISREKTEVDRIVRELDGKLPDEFNYEVTGNADYGLGIEIIDGCPHCGNQCIFNCEFKYDFAQFVGYRSNEDNNEECFIDDADGSFQLISCGTCHTPLVKMERRQRL